MSPTLGGSTVPPRDTVEALVFLKAPATVTVTSAHHTRTKQVPAGISTVRVKLGVGRPTAQIMRGSQVVTTLRSPYAVVRSPFVQDLQYVTSGS